MIGEKQRQVQDHADHGSGNAGEGGGKFQIAMGGFDDRAADQDEEEGWQKGEECHDGCRDDASR